jgi:hypothetical protein
MNGKTGYWDHKTKPSVFVVLDRGKEIFRGSFVEGHKLLTERRKTYNEVVSEYFNDFAYEFK